MFLTFCVTNFNYKYFLQVIESYLLYFQPFLKEKKIFENYKQFTLKDEVILDFVTIMRNKIYLHYFSHIYKCRLKNNVIFF